MTHSAIGENGERPTLLCFSHLRWNFVYQRPQHLLSRAASSYNVIFLEEPLLRDVDRPTLNLSRHDGVTIAVPILPSHTNEDDGIQAQKELVDELLGAVDQDDLVTWYYTPFAMAFSRHLSPTLCVYDNMDELSAFLGASDRLIALERELFAQADVVFTGGQSLFQAKKGRHRNVHAMPSSIDFAHFATARHIQDEPEAQIDVTRPRLGFFGVIDERMDVNLVRQIAQARPQWQLVMVGPVVKIDAASLPRLSNIHWMGAQTYKDLPRFLASWDVGLMPFAINESTRFISPTKTPEFLAAGLRVVSTPIADVIRPYGTMGLVEIAGDAAAFIAKITSLLGQSKADWQRKTDDFLSTMSWDKAWAQMQALMREVQLRRRPRPTIEAVASLEVQGV